MIGTLRVFKSLEQTVVLTVVQGFPADIIRQNQVVQPNGRTYY